MPTLPAPCLATLEPMLAAIFACMSEGVVVHDTEGRIRCSNDSAERILGLTADQLTGRTSLDPRWAAIREDGTPFPGDEHPAMVTLRTGQPCSDVIMGVAKPDGSLTWVAINTRPLTTGAMRGVLATFTDITARRAMEVRLRDSEKFESLGRMAGGVAHDFNNMLTVIRGYGSLMRDEMVDADPFRPHAEAIVEAAEHGAALTRQLLAFSRTQRVCLETVDLGERVRRLEPLIRRLVREDVELALDLYPRALLVRMDPTHLDQVVVNLALNASDAMPEGGRLIIATQPALHRHEDRHADEHAAPVAVLTVTDTGVGMDAQTRQQAFEPFFTTKGPGHGIGLGLSTVHGIVTQAGGGIEVQSAVGRGAALHVRLPLAPADQ